MILIYFSTNGLTERFNQTLCRSLVKFINESQDDWDQKLESILFGYRAAKHRTTGFSPFFMMYHREALLLIDIELMPNPGSDDVEPIDDYIQAMLQVRDDLKPEAMRSIKRAQDYQKEYYDKRHTPQVFPVGAATWDGGTGGKQSTERAKRGETHQQVAWTLHRQP